MTRMVNPGLWPLNKDLVLAGVTGQVLESHVARQRTLKPSLATALRANEIHGPVVTLGRQEYGILNPMWLFSCFWIQDSMRPRDQELLKTQVLNSIDNLLPVTRL